MNKIKKKKPNLLKPPSTKKITEKERERIPLSVNVTRI